MQALPPPPPVTALPAPAPTDDGTRPRPAPPQGGIGSDAAQSGRDHTGQDSGPPGAHDPAGRSEALDLGATEVADRLDAADVVDVADAAAALIPVQRRDRGRVPATTLVRFPPGRTRPRGTPVQDSVVFTAACPACGEDCEWAERRDDTRLSAAVHCSCDGVA